MLRERVFAAGGVVLLLVAVVLLAGLLWAGVGWLFFDAYLAVVIALVLGGFFLVVAREARADRRALLREGESGRP